MPVPGARRQSFFVASGSVAATSLAQPRRFVMRYPILIEDGTETASFGVVVPDLPGCFSAGDTLDEAVEAAREAAAAWVDAALDRGMAVPAPSSLAEVRKLPGYDGWTVGTPI
jgi:predicted RNase H-like HicB family nuclease